MGARVGLQLKALIGEKVEQFIWLDFPVSNNETEYEAILAIVDLGQSVSLEKLLIHSDSQLVVGKVNGEYETREQRADTLAVVVASIPITEIVFLPIYYQPASSITTDWVNQIVEAGPS